MLRTIFFVVFFILCAALVLIPDSPAGCTAGQGLSLRRQRRLERTRYLDGLRRRHPAGGG